ncbi:hypothetical protein FOHLNKBM_5089 [Methylobacterium longum]|nr:hypothetical protein FOHLNKBM_5089 [Methylobacterium longum]
MAVESLFERLGARKHPTLIGHLFDCANCSTEVYRPPSLVKGVVYCSPDCRDRHGLLSVRCRWPGCQIEMPARRCENRRLGTVWKVNLRRTGQYARFPLCPAHLALVKTHLPERSRVQMGHTHWFKDPERDLGTRGITNDAAKLMIWAKTGGRCGACDCSLSMSEKPRRWQIDHVIPVFKGGRTTFANLMPLCGPCHVIKSAPERSEASRNKARTLTGRGLTHPEKDAVIASLRREVDALRAELVAIQETRYGFEARQPRRIPA